jgi:hypothetical protein
VTDLAVLVRAFEAARPRREKEAGTGSTWWRRSRESARC